MLYVNSSKVGAKNGVGNTGAIPIPSRAPHGAQVRVGSRLPVQVIG
jgi:hypothetical protein